MLVAGSYSMVRTRLGGSLSKIPSRKRMLFDSWILKGAVRETVSFLGIGACCAKAVPSPQKADSSSTHHTILHLKIQLKSQIKLVRNYKFFSAYLINSSTVTSGLLLTIPLSNTFSAALRAKTQHYQCRKWPHP